MFLKLTVKLLGGMWKLRERIRNTPDGLYRRVLVDLYTAYLESFGAFMPVEAAVDESTVFPHKPMGIFIAPGTVVGPNCVIYQQVTIGENRPATGAALRAPVVGRGVFVGAGAKIIGGVSVGDGAKIGVNAVVVKDVPAGATVVAPQAVRLP